MVVAMHPLQEDADLVLPALALALPGALVVLPDAVAAKDALVVPEDPPALAAARPALAVVRPAALVLPAVIVVDQTAVIDRPAPHNVAALSVLLTDVVQEAKILQEISKWSLYKIYFTSNPFKRITHTHTHNYRHAHTAKTTLIQLDATWLNQTPQPVSHPTPENDVELNFYQIKTNMLSSHLASLFPIRHI